MKHCCETLDKVVTTKGSRLTFDAVYREYSVEALDGHYFCVFFYPFCGAKTPESKSGDYFTTVSREEDERIIALVVGCSTKDAVLARLGAPDWDYPKMEFTDPVWKQTSKSPAGVLYKNLSATASLRVSFGDDGSILKARTEPKCTRPPNDNEVQTA